MVGSRRSPAVWTLVALALAGVAQCRRLPSAEGRSLLQNDCTALFVMSLGLCTNVLQRDPGTVCCAGMQALDSECLSAMSASLSSPGGDSTSATNLNNILQSCGITPGPAPAPALPPAAAPDATPAPAPGAPPATSPTSAPAPTIGPPAAAPVPGAAPSAIQLPAGSVDYFWFKGDSESVVCPDYTDGDWVDDGTGPEWAATGDAMPSDAEIKAMADPWCSDRTGAPDSWVQALAAGGRSAQVAMAALTFYSCADGAELWDWLADLALNHPAMEAQATGLQYHQAMVAAADASGINFCVTLVVLDPDSDAVLFNQAIHVGPGPDTPEGCLPGFQQSLAICGNATSSPAWSPCCAALSALGDSCRATLAFSSEGGFLTSYGPLASGCNLSNATSALPVGDVYFSYSTSGASAGRAATCRTYSAITERWTDLTNSTWGPSGTDANVPPASDIQAFAAKVCPLGAGAGPVLLEALRAGDLSARVAAALVVPSSAGVSGSVCSDESVQEEVQDAFLYALSALAPAEAQSVSQAVVEAWDAMGVGACVTVRVYDPDTGATLAEQYMHTPVFVPPVGSPPLAVAARSALGSVAVLAPRQKRHRGSRAVRSVR